MRLTGEVLREQREILGKTQSDMAKRCGLSRPTIIKYEKDGEPNIAKMLEAYCLEVYPVVGSMPADIKEIERLIKTSVKNSLGVDCKVKINIEILGGEE